MERFDHYTERCLYGPDGFYATTGSAGRRRGDFITSPEVGPLFGAVVANAIDTWWHKAGNPDPFTVYDVGSGPGTLLASVALARPDHGWRLVNVDRANPAADQAELPDDLTGSVVIANELLDNLPFRVVEVDDNGAPFEVHVDEGAERLVPVDAGSVPTTALIPAGTRAPVLEKATRWVADVVGRNPAHLCLFDYGEPTTAALARRGGWLRTYRDHQRGYDPLVEPGFWDITADIAVDQLPPPTRVRRQHEFLADHGIGALVDEGRAYWQAHAARPDLAAMKMRSRISEAEALSDPAGLGSWLVLEWSALP